MWPQQPVSEAVIGQVGAQVSVLMILAGWVVGNHFGNVMTLCSMAGKNILL